MTQIFISSAQEDSTCAAQIHRDLETQGYRVWQDKQNIDPAWVSYRLAIENGICGSAAVLLVWSASAAQSDWVAAHLSFAQRLKKPVIPVLLDDTDLPNTLIAPSPIKNQPPCTGTAMQLVQHLPPPNSPDPLFPVLEEVTDEHGKRRKEGIEHATQMLQQGKHREELLALLEYMARREVMPSVQEKAQAVLEAEAKKGTALPPFLRPDDARHIFGARCPKGHVTYFDKRRVCSAQGEVVREIEERTGTRLHKLVLNCRECGEEVTVHVDCEGY